MESSLIVLLLVEVWIVIWVLFCERNDLLVFLLCQHGGLLCCVLRLGVLANPGFQYKSAESLSVLLMKQGAVSSQCRIGFCVAEPAALHQKPLQYFCRRRLP